MNQNPRLYRSRALVSFIGTQFSSIGSAILTSLRHGIAHKLGSDPLLGNVNFRRYWFSGILNAFGGQITALAMPLCAVLLLHATPAQMGLLTAAYVLPFALFALPMGVWLDRRTKFPIVLGCEIMYAVALGSVPAAYWLGILSMPWLYTMAFLVGTGLLAGGT